MRVKRVFAAAAFAVLLFTARGALAGYLSTEDYSKLSDPEKVAYVMGMADMMHYTAVASDNKEEIGLIERCFTGRNLGELMRLFDSYLSESPDSAEYDMSSNFHDAVEKRCK